MATWVDYKDSSGNVVTINYNGALDANYSTSKKILLSVQYDKDSASPTSLTIRFKLSNSNKDWYKDEYFIFWQPNVKDQEQFFRVKETGTSTARNWPDYSKAITLTKSYNASSFTIPKFWLCHTGAVCNGETVFTKTNGYLYMTYGDSKTKTIYWYFTNNRKNFKTTVDNGMTLSGISNTVATAVTKGSVTVTDNYNNTFTVNGTSGAAGTLNAITERRLWWSVAKDSAGKWKEDTTEVFPSGKTSHSKTITLTPSGTAATKTVAGAVTTTGKYNKTDTGWVTANIKQYVVPSIPTEVKASNTTYNSTLLLPMNKIWMFEWSGSSAVNDSSPIKGYRVKVLKNGTAISGLVYNLGILTKGSGTNEFVDTEESSYRTIEFNPKDLGFVAHDKVIIRIYPYTKFGSSNTGTKLVNSSYKDSEEFTAKNAGILRAKVNGTWREGQVFVKIGGTWREANTVSTKINGTWRESE